jgi:hypothetical protein
MGERSGVYRDVVGKPEGKRQFGRPTVNGNIILRWILPKQGHGLDLAQNRDRWRAIVNAIMNLCVPSSVGNFSTKNRLASQAGLYTIL